MRKSKLLKSSIATLVLCMALSMTALAEGEQELTLVSTETVETEEVLVQADRHGSILPDVTLYDAVYSNKTQIPLLFNIRSFGNDTEYYQVRIYKGAVADGQLVARTTGDFSTQAGSYNVTYNWDTTNLTVYTEGEYTVTCTSYYNTATGDVLNNTDSCTVTLEDYRLILDRQFVERLYNKVFQRSADPTGLADWSKLLYAKQTTGATTAQGFFGSAEFAQRNTSNEQYVELLYQALFDRDADEEGKANWLNILNSGMSRTYVLKGFVESTEFNQLCTRYEIIQGTIELTENRDKNAGITGFVNRLYSIALNRAADAGGINDWTGRLINKQSTPKAVAQGFVFSAEMSARNLSNTEFVTMLYKTMMNREPDEGGLNNWVGQLNRGTTREAIYNGFADSVEFDAIVKSYGL